MHYKTITALLIATLGRGKQTLVIISQIRWPDKTGILNRDHGKFHCEHYHEFFKLIQHSWIFMRSGLKESLLTVQKVSDLLSFPSLASSLLFSITPASLSATKLLKFKAPNGPALFFSDTNIAVNLL